MNVEKLPAHQPEKEFELAIGWWTAAVPESWPLEVALEEGEFLPAAGLTIQIKRGARLRNGHEALIEAMLKEGYIKEVITDDDSQ